MTTSNTPPAAEPDTPQFDVTLVEATAFNILLAGRLVESPGTPPDLVEDLAREHWQASADVRSSFREEARELLRLLQDEAGLRLRSADAKLLTKRLKWMQTIPPRQAYSSDEISGGR